MRKHVNLEVSLEILSLMLAFAVEDNDEEAIERLKKEKQELYLGNNEVIDKAYNEYSKIIKERMEKNNG